MQLVVAAVPLALVGLIGLHAEHGERLVQVHGDRGAVALLDIDVVRDVALVGGIRGVARLGLVGLLARIVLLLLVDLVDGPARDRL